MGDPSPSGWGIVTGVGVLCVTVFAFFWSNVSPREDIAQIRRDYVPRTEFDAAIKRLDLDRHDTITREEYTADMKRLDQQLTSIDRQLRDLSTMPKQLDELWSKWVQDFNRSKHKFPP